MYYVKLYCLRVLFNCGYKVLSLINMLTYLIFQLNSVYFVVGLCVIHVWLLAAAHIPESILLLSRIFSGRLRAHFFTEVLPAFSMDGLQIA